MPPSRTEEVAEAAAIYVNARRAYERTPVDSVESSRAAQQVAMSWDRLCAAVADYAVPCHERPDLERWAAEGGRGA